MLVSRGESHLLAASEVGLPIVVSSSQRPETSVVNGTHFSLQNASNLEPDTRSSSCIREAPLCLTESKVTFLSLGSLSSNHSSFGARKSSSENCSSSSNNSSSLAINGEAQMSRFMGLARKFNCFYFNGNNFIDILYFKWNSNFILSFYY